MSSPSSHCWFPYTDSNAIPNIQAICLGTGRFLRSVLVPAIVDMNPVLIQPRGDSFWKYMQEKDGNNLYEVDTVMPDGAVDTTAIPCYGGFSMGTAEGSQALEARFPEILKHSNG